MSGIGLTDYTGNVAPVDEEEEPDFDEVVAQSITDQQFIEENTQLPGDVGGPAPSLSEPPPPINQPAPAPAPDPAALFGPMGEGLMTAPPETPASFMPPPVQPTGTYDTSLGGEGLLGAQPDPFEDNWLLGEIEQNTTAYEGVDESLNSLIGVDDLLNMTPGQLAQKEQSEGYGIGPLAGLNQEIVNKNLEYTDVVAQLDAMNPENFTTQGQVDSFNYLIGEYTRLQGELQGLIDSYVETGEGLIDQHEDLSETLIGDEGLIPRFNELYGAGGLLDRRREVARTDTRGTLDIDEELYNLFGRGILDIDFGAGQTSFTFSDRMLDQQDAYARQRNAERTAARRHKQRLQIGFTTEQFQQFADDPGFQEYASQLLVDRALPDELADLGLSQLAFSPGQSNDYRPSPGVTDLIANAWGAIPDPVSGALGSVGELGLRSIELPGRAAGIVGGGELLSGFRALELSADSLEQLVDPQAQRRSNRTISEDPFSSLVPTAVSPEGFRAVSPTTTIPETREAWGELPWQATIAGEIVLDPLNLVGIGALKSAFKTARFAKSVDRMKGVSAEVYEDALRVGTRADTDYVKSAGIISNSPMTKIDTFKLVDTQARFKDTAQSTFRISGNEADRFGNRVAYRLYTNPETEWTRILNEEAGRLAERSTVVMDAKATAKFNSELGKSEAFSRLFGADFWEAMDGNFPKVMQDTPQWRQGRETRLPNPDDITDTRAGGTAALDDLVAVGHGPQITMEERWGDLSEISANGFVTPSYRYRPDYLTPQSAPVASPDAVTAEMMTVLERAAKNGNVAIERTPTTLTEYDEAWKKVIKQLGERPFPEGRTVNDIVRDPRYQAMHQNARGSLRQGVLPDMAAAPVDPHQISQLYKHSYFQRRNLIDDLAAQAGIGPAFSARRYKGIIDNLPATEWQKAQIRGLSKGKKSYPQSSIDRMTTWDANEIIWSNNATKYKNKAASLKKVSIIYEDDIEKVIQNSRDMQFQSEAKAMIADVLTPQGEGRYTFTRPAKRPDGTTAAGWARLSEFELLNAMAKAGPRIFHLPTYGPAITEIAENVRRMSGIRAGGIDPGRAGQNIRARSGGGAYPQLLNDSRKILDDLVDELTEIASPAETYDFHKWLVNLYDGSYLPRAKEVVRRPEDFAPNSEKMIDFKKISNELAYRQSERSMILDKQARFRAVTEMTAYGSKRLDWNQLARMDERAAIRTIDEFFANPDSPMTKDGFSELINMAKFLPPGKGSFTYREVLKEYRNLYNAERLLRREITEFGDRAQGMADTLGVDGLDNLRSFSLEPQITDFVRQFEAQYPDYARYSPDFSNPLSDPAGRRLALKESTQEVAFSVQRMIDRGAARDANLYTPPVWEAPIFEGRPRYISRGAWENNPEMNQRLQTAFSQFNQTPANTARVDEIASRLISSNIPVAPDDLTSQALLVHGYSFKEIAERAGVSQNTAKRLRSAINGELTRGTNIHPTQIANDARAMREAIDIADNFQTILSEQPQRLGDLEPSKIELVAGKLKVPDGLVNPLLDHLDDQYKLSLLWQPGDLTKRSAKAVREGAQKALQAVLDFFQFEVRDRVMSSRVMDLFGDEGARFIRPNHQRPTVAIFDPITSHMKQVDWRRHGKVFDTLMDQFFEVDQVWGKQARRFTPAQLGDMTKMSKGVEIGYVTSMVGHSVMANILEFTARTRENSASVYDDILDHMDQIIEGGPAADMLYRDMFEGSGRMQRFLTWARATDDSGTRMWDKVTENWGDLTPHMSISKMPRGLHDELFTPMRTGVTRRSRSGNRAPVMRDVQRLDDFIRGNLNLGDLSDSERIEADLWRDALSQNWDDIKPQLQEGVEGGKRFRKGVHVDDLDALFQFDATDPFDPQRFADRLGTVASMLEHQRIKYDPSKVSPLLRFNHGVKATLGFVWLRMSPRYLIHNFYGNYASIGLNQAHSERRTGVRMVKRVDEALENRRSSVYRNQNLSQGIAQTETSWGGPRAAATRKLRQTRARQDLFASPAGGKFSFIQNSPVARAAKGVGKAGRSYTDFNARATDFFEIDARKRVYTNEFDYNYQRAWEAGLDRVDGLDAVVKGQIAEELELSNISKILTDAGVDATQKARVFRAYNGAVTQGHLRAYNSTKDVMRDYLIRNRFDNAMDQIFPYHFWMTKNLAFVTGTVMDRPATVLQGGRIYDAWSEEWEDMPYSFRERVQIKKVPGFVPGIGGKEIGFRPHNITNPAFFILPAVVDEMRDAWERYEDMPIYERMARSTAGGVKTAWEEMGYSAGPHLDATVGAMTSKRADQLAAEMGDDVEFWKQEYVDNGANLLIRPMGFEQEILPLGGLEDAALWAAGTNSKTDVARNWYALANQLTKGSSFTRAEVNKMGFIGFEMVRNGDITEAEFDEVQRLVLDGNYEAIDSHPVGSKVLDRLYKNQGQRSGIGYTTSLSYTEFGPEWKEAYEANKTYQTMKIEDEFIPVPHDATDIQKKLIGGLNAKIEQLHVDQTRHLEINNFSPDAIAESQREFYLWNVESGLGKIYKQAREAGIEVPQLKGDGPNTANEWAFGKRNPATGEREDGNAPWLAIYWRANDNEEDLARRDARTAEFEENQRLWDVQEQAWRTREERYGESAPYWDDIDTIREDERQKLNDLHRRGLSETAERRLEDQIMDDTRGKIGKVYDAAEQEGISLRGTGSTPRQTSTWYDLADSGNGDVRYIYEQAGLGVPRDRELLALDQAVALNQVEDQVEAHTTWAMRETIDALDLNPYLENGAVNPRFATDGFFDRDKWNDEVKRNAGNIENAYHEIVRAHRIGAGSRDAMTGGSGGVDLLARPAGFDEIFQFAQDDVLPRQTAYDMGFNAALDKVFNSSGDERDTLVRQGVNEFGPAFETIANGDRIKVDMDEVATTISNFYNGLTGGEKEAFEEEWGDHIVDGGDIRVIDPETLGYREAVVIADRYGLEIPTYAEQFNLSRNRQALTDAWDQLSKDQQREFKGVWEGDESLPDDFVLTLSGTDDETGEPYDFDVAAFDALDGRQIAKLIDQLGAPVDAYFPEEQLVGGPLDSGDTVTPRSPKFQKLLEDAAHDKEMEVVTESFFSGEAFLDDPGDVEAWQSIQSLRGQHPGLYEAGRKLIEDNGLSWQWLVDNLDPTQKQGGEDMVTLREFAEMYTYTLEESDYDRLINERRKWLRGEGSEYTDLVARYLDDRDPLAVDAQAQGRNGTLYGFEGEDLENWQEFYGYIDEHSEVYSAAQAMRSEGELTWAELIGALDEGPIRDFAEGYVGRIEDYDMGDLWDRRNAFFGTEYGQELVVRSPDDFARYTPEASSGGSQSSGGSVRRSGSGGRSFGSSGGSSRRPPSSSGKVMTDYSTPVREIFRLDSAMMTGDAPDSVARYDAAIAVADVIEARLEWAVTMGLDSYVELMGKIMLRSIQRFLGESPTLELWQELLEKLGGGLPEPEPSDELAEQPEFEGVEERQEAVV